MDLQEDIRQFQHKIEREIKEYVKLSVMAKRLEAKYVEKSEELSRKKAMGNMKTPKEDPVKTFTEQLQEIHPTDEAEKDDNYLTYLTAKLVTSMAELAEVTKQQDALKAEEVKEDRELEEILIAKMRKMQEQEKKRLTIEAERKSLKCTIFFIKEEIENRNRSIQEDHENADAGSGN